MTRRYSPVDALLSRLNDGLRVLNQAQAPVAATPVAAAARVEPEAELDEGERRHAAGLMRVNHAGEVAAQALYLGQALTARQRETRAHLLKAAAEERAHLAWCEQRLHELGQGPSKLQPLWFGGSFAIGALAGMAGDRWSLGFVEETEKQVCEHLDGHLDKLPPGDDRSRAILEAMRADEARHGQHAAERGARPLPAPVRMLMRGISRIMTRTAYRV